MTRLEFLNELDARRKALAKIYEADLSSQSKKEEYSAAEANWASYSVWLRTGKTTTSPVSEPNGITD